MRAIPSLGLSITLIALVALLTIATTSVNAQALYREGQHYLPVNTPTTPKDPSKIEVTEIFWYGCPHCQQFQPVFSQWKQQQADDVRIMHMPAMWNKPMRTHARIFYTAKALGVLGKVHKDAFDAMHVEKKRLLKESEVFSLFEKHGIDRKVFDKTFHSFGLKSQVQRANNLAKAYGTTGTPEVIVNGKYRVSGSTAGSQSEMLNVINFLIAKERANKKS
ncbi:disulfide bond formation protein DsbA [Candidatus Endobugula sertula]|uniref:Thiol:disulfide interchange protein n=1 Tax=Candidatus Endobugula sertula TaxID=62101 RepID=A0A1D2QSM7_9GAMM|nr:disulfide bond formation protein DsbA [Candidatus Endobugula sertula]